MSYNFSEAIDNLKKEKKRKFNQSVELIVNLKDFDIRKDSLNTFLQLPFAPSEKTVCAFLDKPNNQFDSAILKADFDKWQDKKEMKKLAKDYDFFVAVPSVMQLVATKFGRILGPMGKMPSPQLGLLISQDEKSVNEMIAKLRKTTRIKAKEPSVKILIGKEDMETLKIAQNAEAVYNVVVNALPKKKENIKSLIIKFTMSKPIKLVLK
jgi:large subunit ribosomal protein L1